MYKLSALLLFILTNNTIICMDPAPQNEPNKKSSKKEKKDSLSDSKRSKSEGTGREKTERERRRSAHFSTNPPKKTSLSDTKKRIDKAPLSAISENSSAMNGFLTAVRTNKIEQVKLYLRNKRLPLDDTDQYGNTAPHLAALDGHFEIIDILLLDPRTKTNIKNDSDSFPQGLLERHRDGASPELIQKISRYKEMFFAHSTLNENTKKYALKLHLFYARGNIDEQVFVGIIQTIKSKIAADKKTQSTDLPTLAQLPTYATDDFIRSMLDDELAILMLKDKLLISSNPKK